MSLSAAEIGSVVARWRRDLTGAFVRRAISPVAEDRIALELYGVSGEAFAEIVTSTGACRLCRIAAKPKAAERPHPFVMLLRREAVGLRIEDVRQIGGDRVVAIDLAGDARRGSLVCELLSRHGNLFWIGEGGAIAGSFHPNRSHLRTLVPGSPYEPPRPHPAATEAVQRFADDERLEESIALHYAQREALESEGAERKRLGGAVRRFAARLEKLAGKVARDLERTAEGRRLQDSAHVLQANLGRVPKGASSVSLEDFEGRPIVVPLDPARSAVENMTRLFEKAKRLKGATPRIEERAQRIAWELEALARFAEEIGRADGPALEAVRVEIARSFPAIVPASRTARRKDPERSPFHELAIAAGRVARVGRSAADNDTLTLRFARPDDLWLHVRGGAGSHVVVPLGRGEEPTPEMLVDAAHLAAFFSKSKDREDVEVTYTRRRYVQKPKGAPPGSVRLLREKTIFLRIEPDRLARLLDREPG
ncbi:MAG: NFACT family protein [Proteobacteria bacterium]|jgi:predicted ribosome quality control (RQC) complex YloA/Tae2 family protein|nr:NFACT family protein [Pseudomonadota bacterium]